MNIGRNIMREEAKKVYKREAKKYPKKQRIPFSQFFKKYKEAMKVKQVQEVGPKQEQDFDFNDMVQLNDLTKIDNEIIQDDGIEAEVVGQANMPKEIKDADID